MGALGEGEEENLVMVGLSEENHCRLCERETERESLPQQMYILCFLLLLGVVKLLQQNGSTNLSLLGRRYRSGTEKW